MGNASSSPSKSQRDSEAEDVTASEQAKQIVAEVQTSFKKSIRQLGDENSFIDTLCGPVFDPDAKEMRSQRSYAYSEDMSEDSRTVSEDDTLESNYRRRKGRSTESGSVFSQSENESEAASSRRDKGSQSFESEDESLIDRNKDTKATAKDASTTLEKKATPTLPKPLASSFAKRCYFTKAGIGKTTQHYEGLTLTGNVVLMLAAAMKLKGCPTICDEDLRRVEQTYPNQFSRLPDELLLSSGWRRISKYCHFSNKPIPDGVPFFHSKQRVHSTGGYYFLLAAAVGMIRPIDVEPLTRDTLVLLETDYPTPCDAAPPQLIQDPAEWTLVDNFCFFSGGPINTEEDVYYQADFDGNPIYMLAFLSPSLTPEELYKLSLDNTDEPGLKSAMQVAEVESVYDLTERDFDDLKLYHLGPCRALPPYILQPQAWTKVLPPHFLAAKHRAMMRAQRWEEVHGIATESIASSAVVSPAAVIPEQATEMLQQQQQLETPVYPQDMLNFNYAQSPAASAMQQQMPSPLQTGTMPQGKPQSTVSPGMVPASPGFYAASPGMSPHHVMAGISPLAAPSPHAPQQYYNSPQHTGYPQQHPVGAPYLTPPQYPTPPPHGAPYPIPQQQQQVYGFYQAPPPPTPPKPPQQQPSPPGPKSPDTSDSVSFQRDVEEEGAFVSSTASVPLDKAMDTRKHSKRLSASRNPVSPPGYRPSDGPSLAGSKMDPPDDEPPSLSISRENIPDDEAFQESQSYYLSQPNTPATANGEPQYFEGQDGQYYSSPDKASGSEYYSREDEYYDSPEQHGHNPYPPPQQQHPSGEYYHEQELAASPQDYHPDDPNYVASPPQDEYHEAYHGEEYHDDAQYHGEPHPDYQPSPRNMHPDYDHGDGEYHGEPHPDYQQSPRNHDMHNGEYHHGDGDYRGEPLSPEQADYHRSPERDENEPPSQFAPIQTQHEEVVSPKSEVSRGSSLTASEFSQSSAMVMAQDLLKRNRKKRIDLERQKKLSFPLQEDDEPSVSHSEFEESGSEMTSVISGSSVWTDSSNPDRSSRRALILQMAKARMKSNKPAHQEDKTNVPIVEEDSLNSSRRDHSRSEVGTDIDFDQELD